MIDQHKDYHRGSVKSKLKEPIRGLDHWFGVPKIQEEDYGLVVDITCGHLGIQREIGLKADVNLDISPKVNCDFVADFKNLPFPNESVDIILFDPPYGPSFIPDNYRPWEKPEHHWTSQNGMFKTREDTMKQIGGAFKEIDRVLKPTGLCLFKWGERAFRLNRIMELCPLAWEVIYWRYSISASKRRVDAGSANKTYWVQLWKVRKNEPVQ